MRAADVHRRYELATVDAIVHATALQHDADLLTCGAHFGSLPRVVLFDKTTS